MRNTIFPKIITKSIFKGRMLFILILLGFSFLVTACGDAGIASLKEVSEYSYDELKTFAKFVTKEELLQSWGNPCTENNPGIWIVKKNEGNKYVAVIFEANRVDSVMVSTPLYVTVTNIEGTAAYGTVDFNDYTNDAGQLTILPGKDWFGNDIHYNVGDLYEFEFDGMIRESYPAQISSPYAVKLTGHLQDKESE